MIRTDSKLWADRVSRLEAYHDLIKRFLFEASRKQKVQYNKRRVDVKFSVGDLVYKKTHYQSDAGKRFSAKLAKPYTEPHKIVKVVSPQVYIISYINSM